MIYRASRIRSGIEQDLHIQITDPTRVWRSAGNVVLEGGREVRARAVVEAEVGADTLVVSVGADEDMTISRSGLR